MQEQTITALCAALTAQQLPFAQGEPKPDIEEVREIGVSDIVIVWWIGTDQGPAVLSLLGVSLTYSGA